MPQKYKFCAFPSKKNRCFIFFDEKLTIKKISTRDTKGEFLGKQKYFYQKSKKKP
ncbi:MAG: hypothetical protein RL757_2804 [Bacteroidota bacterium]|jgi:hypothetical protein